MARPQGAASILSRRDIEGHVVTRETNPVTVAGVGQLLGADPERTIMLLYNLSAAEIFISFTSEVSSTNGMLLAPNGGFIVINATDDYELSQLPVWAFSVGAGNQLYLMTTRREIKVEEE